MALLIELVVESAWRAGWSLLEYDLFAHPIGSPPVDAASQESAMRTQAMGAGFEGLEERLLLAGNVLSALVAGVLVLDGDALANQVQITVASNGQMTATGLSGTTIDGLASVNFGVVNTLTVNGGAGNDTISLNSTAAAIANDVTIDGGIDNDTISVAGRFGTNLIINGAAGLDTITVGNSTVAVDLDLDAGDGNDKVTLSGSTIRRDALIQTGLGNDSVNVNGMSIYRDLSLTDTGGNNLLSLSNSSTRNDTLVALGAGNDAVLINGLTAGVRTGATAQGLISIDFGDGKNVLSMSKVKVLGTAIGDGLLLTGGTGNDAFGIVDTQSAGGIQIDTGDGTNRVEMTRIQITGIFGLDIVTGVGADSLKLDRLNVSGLVTIDTGAGNDIFQLTNSRCLFFSGFLGAGDDAAYLNSNFYDLAVSGLSGGLGVDALTLGANSPNNNVIFPLFETTRFAR